MEGGVLWGVLGVCGGVVSWEEGEGRRSEGLF